MDKDPELDRWNGRFSAPGFVFGEAPNAFLSRQAPHLKAGMSALSVADGEGRNGVWLARQGLKVTTFDLDRKSTRLNSSHIPLSRMPSSA